MRFPNHQSAAFLSMALAGAVASTASAGSIDATVFTNSDPRITFENLPLGIQPNGPLTVQGVTFSETSSGSENDLGETDPESGESIFTPGWRVQDSEGPSGYVLTDDHGLSQIRLDFATPTSRAGLSFLLPGTFDIRFFALDSSFLGIVTVSPGEEALVTPVFAGWEDVNFPISFLTIDEMSGDNGTVAAIDNVRFAAVPDNGSTLALLGACFLGLAAFQGVASRKAKA